MNGIAPTPNAKSPREMVAAEVRSQLARRKGINSNTLPQHVGKSQRYWNDRLNAKVAFSTDDLGLISWLLDEPMSVLIPAVVADVRPELPMGPAAIGGGTLLYGIPGARSWKLPHLDSNQEPIVSQREPNPIKQLDDYRKNHTASRRSAARR